MTDRLKSMFETIDATRKSYWPTSVCMSSPMTSYQSTIMFSHSVRVFIVTRIPWPFTTLHVCTHSQLISYISIVYWRLGIRFESSLLPQFLTADQTACLHTFTSNLKHLCTCAEPSGWLNLPSYPRNHKWTENWPMVMLRQLVTNIYCTCPFSYSKFLRN